MKFSPRMILWIIIIPIVIYILINSFSGEGF